MTVKLLTEHHLEFLSLEATQAHMSLHVSKCHIVRNHMSRLNYVVGSQKNHLNEMVLLSTHNNVFVEIQEK